MGVADTGPVVSSRRQPGQPQPPRRPARRAQQAAVSGCGDSCESTSVKGPRDRPAEARQRLSKVFSRKNESLTYSNCLPQARHYQTPAFSSASADHGQFGGGQAVHEPYGVAPAQHASTYAPGPSVPVSFASSSQIRGTKTQTQQPLCAFMSLCYFGAIKSKCWPSLSRFTGPRCAPVRFRGGGGVRDLMKVLARQAHLHFRPCSTSPTSSQATRSTVTSRPSRVSPPHPERPPFPRSSGARLSCALPCLHAGFIPGAGIPLQKQLEHANQQSGFTDAVGHACG